VNIRAAGVARIDSAEQFRSPGLLAVLSGKAGEKQTARKTFSIKVAGEIDKSPAQTVATPRAPARRLRGSAAITLVSNKLKRGFASFGRSI
jgi:hypothetical protein